MDAGCVGVTAAGTLSTLGRHAGHDTTDKARAAGMPPAPAGRAAAGVTARLLHFREASYPRHREDELVVKVQLPDIVSNVNDLGCQGCVHISYSQQIN